MIRLLRLISLFFLLTVAITNAQSLSGTFTIPGDYPTFTAAIADLKSRGVNGAVTFNVLNDTCNEQNEITAVGTTLQLQAYASMDDSVTNGSYSYRFQPIHTNGSFEFIRNNFCHDWRSGAF